MIKLLFFIMTVLLQWLDNAYLHQVFGANVATAEPVERKQHRRVTALQRLLRTTKKEKKREKDKKEKTLMRHDREYF